VKLIFCPGCTDLVRLMKEIRFCKCKESWGLYKEDGLHAIIGGRSVPMGINNFRFCLMGGLVVGDEMPLSVELFRISADSDRIEWGNLEELQSKDKLTLGIGIAPAVKIEDSPEDSS